MSFSGRTPESLLPRSDSKNPATTCKGITTNGRPCRRALASNSPLPSPGRGNGVIAVLDDNDAAAFYCWQHKDQAENLAQQPEQHTTLYPLKERSSLDTLVDRVGIINLDEEIRPPKKVHHRKKRSNDGHLITRRDTLPSSWQDMQSPLMTVPEEVTQDQHQHQRLRQSSKKHGRSNVKFSWACCLRVDDDDEPRRPRQTQQVRPSQQGHNQPPQMTYQSQNTAHDSPTRRKPVSAAQYTPQPAPKRTSETQNLLSLIPKTLSPQVTSSLLAELSRPLSPHDEDGYIYIFWLTPDSDTSPDDDTASSLLDDNSHSPNRRDAVLQRYASVRRPSNTLTSFNAQKKTIMLKIGRAQNVHRRMSQWSKQCGQNITLIRYYPHSPSSASSTPAPPRKVPNVGRVERLIHLELSDKKAIKDECEQCGREHREWFEVGASRDGLKSIDACVRRWVGWSLAQNPTQTSRESANQASAGGKRRDDDGAAREAKIHARAWENADRIRDDAWRDTGAAGTRVGNDLGGYY